MRSGAFFGCLLSLALASCGSEEEASRESNGAAAAEGEVLSGSISDEMLPLDQLRSHSPHLEQPSSSDGTRENESEGNGPAETPSEPVAQTAEPAPSVPPAEASEDEG